MKKILIILAIFIAMPAFAYKDIYGNETNIFGNETDIIKATEQANANMANNQSLGSWDENGGVKMPFADNPGLSLEESTAAIQSQPYFNNDDFAMWFFSLFGIGVVALVLMLICHSVDNMGTTKDSREAQKRNAETKDELLLIQNLVNTFQTAKDAEIAECVYALMTYRDDRYNTSQIQAFLFPEEYEALIKNYILDDLKKSINQLKLLKHKNIVLAVIWWHTLNSYIADKNTHLIQELWTQLARGFELSRSKYLETSSKKFNFDNSNFFQVPKGMLNN